MMVSLVGNDFIPPAHRTHSRTHIHTTGQSFFNQPCGPLTGLGEGLPPCKADWQEWHLRIATLIMGICSDAPVWGSSRVLGCCHRDGGEPLVVLGGRQRPPYSLEGWPDMTPHNSPLLIWVGTGSSQPGEREIFPASFWGPWVHLLRGAETLLVSVQEYCSSESVVPAFLNDFHINTERLNCNMVVQIQKTYVQTN